MQLGFIGLGKMGGRMAEKLALDGHTLVVWNRTTDVATSFVKVNPKNITVAKSVQELVTSLQNPRIIWLMLPAGQATQDVLDAVTRYLEKGDIVIDGGNAHFSDTQRRFETLSSERIRFLGIGVSGGIVAFAKGYPLMAGGDREAYEHITPILDSLARPAGGHAYFGKGGAGHFIKMVHNGIEYGMMQSLGEGFGVLAKSPYELDLDKVAKLWQKGTIISGFLLDRTASALSKDPKLSEITGVIEASGEAAWTIEQAKKEQVSVSVIEDSLAFREKSQTDTAIQQSFAAKLVAALRHEFGGHSIKKKE